MEIEASRDSASWLRVPVAERTAPGIPDVGGLFRSYRRVHRMTQAGLASFLGLDQSYVSKIEKGDRQVRDVKVLQWIGMRLGVPLEDLGLSPGPYAVAAVRDPERLALTRRVQESQRQWRLVRRSLNQRRLELTRIAAGLYDGVERIRRTALLTQPSWQPAAPVDLADIELEFASPPETARFVTGAEPEAEPVRPLSAHGMPYTRYTRAIRDCDRPALFENRLGYRLVDVDWAAGADRDRGLLSFGHTTYFDMLDVCEAAAHELAALQFLREKGRFSEAGAEPADGRAAAEGPPLSLDDLPFRRLVGCPFDLSTRPLLPSINTITLRRGRSSAAFILHWRDPVQVAVAGGMFHVMPAGVFQPSSISPDAQAQDFDLWRNVMREFSEEFLGNPDHDGSSGDPIDYQNTEPFRSLGRARESGDLRMMCLGMGVDPLTLAGEILTVAVIEDHVFDRIFDSLVPANTEGTIVAAPNRNHAEGVPFTGTNVERLLGSGLMAPAAAACLYLAWQHRGLLLGGPRPR
jgi:transcriptional regulator with XRE-family HTH domain